MTVAADKERIAITLKRTTLTLLDIEAKKHKRYQAELAADIIEKHYLQKLQEQIKDDK